MEETPTRRLLEDRLAKIEGKIREVVSAEFNEWLELQAAINAIDAARTPKLGEYGHFRKAIDAVEAYLRKRGEKAHRREIARHLKQGGFAPDAKRPGINVLDAIDYHSEQGQRVTLDEDGMVGLLEWSQKRPPSKA